jgi:hypothetical protein
MLPSRFGRMGGAKVQWDSMAPRAYINRVPHQLAGSHHSSAIALANPLMTHAS